MGWGPGYDPKDGDGPHDRFYGLDRQWVGPALTRLFAGKRRTYGDPRFALWEDAGLLQIVWDAGLSVPRGVVKTVLDGLNDLAGDRDWIDAWRDPERHREALDKWRSKLRVGLANTRRRNGMFPVTEFDLTCDRALVRKKGHRRGTFTLCLKRKPRAKAPGKRGKK